MILPTMTLPELSNELLKDYKEVAARWKAFEPKFVRMRKRWDIFPWLWETTVQTKRKNEWYIGYYAYTKKDACAIWPQIAIYFRYMNATWAAFPIQGKGKTLLLIFSSHFFERYMERFLKIAQSEMQCPVKEVVKFFFIRNYHIYPYKPEAEDQVRGFCEDGMFLGDWISEDVGLVKTFLSRNELKVNQRTEYYGAMLNWIIGDMYMVRSGGSLTLEEFDKLPDEWFSIQTWRAFVASRGNPMWNNLLIDYVTFRKEHPKEYKLCSDMLERIADNRILDEE